MSSSPVLTVSIVTFRTDITLLQNALASLRACLLPMSVVIVDNTPEPEYFATLKVLEGVQCISSPYNGGYGHGHNQALKICPPAPYHLILNPDVVMRPGCLETLVAKMEQQQDVVLAVPKILNEDGTLQPLNKCHPTVLDLVLRRLASKYVRMVPAMSRRMDQYVRMELGYDSPCEVPFVSGCFMLFRRSALDSLQGFDDRFFMYFEDADISRRASALGRVQFYPDAVITHKWSGGYRTSWYLTYAIIVSASQYFQKWGWRWW